jgi:purine-binding chemotaxis protein CheW
MPMRSQALIFTVGGLLCALQLDVIKRVTRVVSITPVPGASAGVLGVINFAGRWIPVVNVRKRLGLPERAIQLSDVLIVTYFSSRLVALLVDEAVQIADFNEKGVDVQFGSESVLIYDVRSFLSPEDQASLNEVSPL